MHATCSWICQCTIESTCKQKKKGYQWKGQLSDNTCPIEKSGVHSINTLHTSLAMDVSSVNRERNGCPQGVSVSEYESLEKNIVVRVYMERKIRYMKFTSLNMINPTSGFYITFH